MSKVTLATINEKYATEPEWRVTVHCAEHDDFTVTLNAPREGLAKTNAMFLYPHQLSGQRIDYTVEQVTYKVVRFFQDDRPTKTVKRGLTLAEAQAHCRRDDTHGEGWFDGYDEER